MNTPKLILCALLTALLILALINYPAFTLAGVFVGGALAALLGGVWLGEAHLDGKEYNKEHDLP